MAASTAAQGLAWREQEKGQVTACRLPRRGARAQTGSSRERSRRLAVPDGVTASRTSVESTGARKPKGQRAPVRPTSARTASPPIYRGHIDR